MRNATALSTRGRDPEVVTQRTSPFAGASKPAGAANSVFDAGRQAKPSKHRAPPIDVATIAITRGVPLPERVYGATGAGERYQALLDKMKPGDSVELLAQQARGLQSYVKKSTTAGKVALRRLSETHTGVWKL